MLSHSNRAAIQLLSAVLKQPRAQLPKVPQHERVPGHFIGLIRQKELREILSVSDGQKGYFKIGNQKETQSSKSKDSKERRGDK